MILQRFLKQQNNTYTHRICRLCVLLNIYNILFVSLSISISLISVDLFISLFSRAPVIGLYCFTYWKRHKFVVHAYRTTLCKHTHTHTQQKCNSIESGIVVYSRSSSVVESNHIIDFLCDQGQRNRINSQKINKKE